MAIKRKNSKNKKSAAAKSKPKARTKIKAKKPSRTRTISARRRPRPGVGESDRIAPIRRLRGATAAAGQSGDTQGLSEIEDAGPESVEELADEGQAFEAEAISGVENARRPDKSRIRTREVVEDDVPEEYDEDTQ